ncbi:MAG: hypothetical protein K2G55_20070, partial [Lachnospiraceae bacterium]|nr:hypothetical protein [Lachnospiraceae bacterium]
KTGVPMSVAVIVYVIEIAAKVIFQKHGTLTTDELVIPIMNVFVTFIIDAGGLAVLLCSCF